MRTTMKSTTLWEENKMKILEDYKKIAHELLFEVDDEKMIKYKDKDGESKEMKAGSAKTMPADHPAKQAWDKMQDGGGDDKEKPSGQKIGGSDFDRDAQNQKDADDWASKMFGAEKDKVTGGDDGDDAKSYKPKYFHGMREPSDREHMEKEYDVRIPKGTMEPDKYGEDEVAEKIADALAKKFDISREYAMSRAKDEVSTNNFYLDFADELETEFQEMADEGGHQRYDEPMFDTQGMEKMKYGGKEENDDKSKMIAKHGTNLPSGTDSNTKVSDLGEDEVEEFFDDVADEYSEEYNISRGVMADYSDQILRQAREEGESMGDLIDNIESAAQEAAEEGGYEEYEESVKPKKKPFLKEQLERFGGGRY